MFKWSKSKHNGRLNAQSRKIAQSTPHIATTSLSHLSLNVKGNSNASGRTGGGAFNMLKAKLGLSSSQHTLSNIAESDIIFQHEFSTSSNLAHIHHDEMVIENIVSPTKAENIEGNVVMRTLSLPPGTQQHRMLQTSSAATSALRSRQVVSLPPMAPPDSSSLSSVSSLASVRFTATSRLTLLIECRSLAERLSTAAVTELRCSHVWIDARGASTMDVDLLKLRSHLQALPVLAAATQSQLLYGGSAADLLECINRIKAETIELLRKSRSTADQLVQLNSPDVLPSCNITPSLDYVLLSRACDEVHCAIQRLVLCLELSILCFSSPLHLSLACRELAGALNHLTANCSLSKLSGEARETLILSLRVVSSQAACVLHTLRRSCTSLSPSNFSLLLNRLSPAAVALRAALDSLLASALSEPLLVGRPVQLTPEKCAQRLTLCGAAQAVLSSLVAYVDALGDNFSLPSAATIFNQQALAPSPPDRLTACVRAVSQECAHFEALLQPQNGVH